MSKFDKNHDWTGYIVVIPEQHNLIIVGRWKENRPDMWWWKCKDCFESAGVMSVIQIEKLLKKGMIAPPDGEDLPSKYSRHPDESDAMYEAMYGMYD